MKQIFILSLFSSVLFYSQKIQVIDAENNQPVAGARIILPGQLVYTNEDGYAPVAADSGSFEVSAPGYQAQKESHFKNTVLLKPSVKDIEEVKIINVDLQKLFEDLQKNYHKRYYDEPSLYDITFKSRGFNNDSLFFLVIAEAKLWSKSNSYDFRDGYRKNYDEILQMQLNKVRYFKKNEESVFNAKSNEFSHSDMGDFFFSFEVHRVLANLKMKNTKTSGRLLSENGDMQTIGIKILSGSGITIEGEMQYNKKDKAVAMYDVYYQQSGYPSYKRTNTAGKEYDYQLGDVQIVYDFYKKDGSYIPALKKMSGDRFKIIHDGITDERKFDTEIIYHTFTKSDRKGLVSKVDFSKSIWENVPVKEDKEAGILLSEKEQAFINGN
ncbi:MULTISPECIES: hypothetical protein [Chryseobacterium]|uniref:Carboxypeptidase-like regulatory domain-containing protein n=1 Tax=Chryseobacterium camelliae TaxID=1265445 RepID=A0ABU0THG6_9FLAO|nr:MULTISPECIES: hypothetical protein [Chryseobacterium]MDT3405693.1 hypothetical protein [Pseudacidovorax intermedius]MDQ1096499.1 hypothetical protein [Chryseobacterium camelliae]MDQ1100440.1 hypothetical protein [Chryseobacterium sp. SORGH_AS_1048]MDR6087780.1 hypothetical protein [Chryseobacterium sp. SORGH_AS_0909]MDR6132156.1 hypothetical protein [Chryseobacterium sp. SORGH_AS_1175]